MSLPTLPADAGLLTRLSLAARCLMVLKDDPGNTHYGPLFNACMDTETYARIAARWRQSKEGRALLDGRPSLQGPDLDLGALAALPHDTLGHALYRYFDALKITPFVSDFPVTSDVDYLSKRYRETHDLLHVLTGYEIDDYSEMELQAFVLGNMGLRQTLLILFFGLMTLLPKAGPWAMLRYPGDLRRAYQRGKASRSLLDVRFEDLWAEPLESVRARLVAPAPDRRPSPLTWPTSGAPA